MNHQYMFCLDGRRTSLEPGDRLVYVRDKREITFWRGPDQLHVTEMGSGKLYPIGCDMAHFVEMAMLISSCACLPIEFGVDLLSGKLTTP